MTVSPEKVIDSPTLHRENETASSHVLAPPELLAHPEDEEQPVVGPGPEQHHGQQDGGQVGDLHAEVAGDGDDRPGGDQGHRRGEQGHQRGQQGPEGEEQKGQDEQDREQLGEGLGLAVLVLLVDVLGQRPGQVHRQTGWGPDVVKVERSSATVPPPVAWRSQTRAWRSSTKRDPGPPVGRRSLIHHRASPAGSSAWPARRGRWRRCRPGQCVSRGVDAATYVTRRSC